jgi:N utilization substance protein A
VKALILEVRRDAKGPQIVVSRSHPDLVRRLLELEVPELLDGTVEIRAIAREPGHRTKIAVASNDPNVDPKGACVGARGSRVRQVVNELRTEKVDVVQWREDPAQLIAEALGPAKVREVRIDEEARAAVVVVSDHQLSLAIGREGQNARLAARLTGYRVDIRSETEEAGGTVESPVDRVPAETVTPETVPAEAVAAEAATGTADGTVAAPPQPVDDGEPAGETTAEVAGEEEATAAGAAELEPAADTAEAVEETVGASDEDAAVPVAAEE